MKVVIGSDHAGFQLKNAMGDLLRSMGNDVLDVGAFNENPSVGASVAANKLPGIRAGMCHDTYSAHQGVEHDNINVLVLGSRVVGIALAQDLVRAFMGAKFTNEERHVRRLGKVKALETKYCPGS
jgi:ribose 5-phosphate isomerase B